MAAVAQPVAETKIALSNVPWSTYESLLAAHVDQPGIRFFFDAGDLEVMTVSFRHEEPAKLLNMVVEILAEEFEIDVRSIGSATFKREALGKGFEPDQGFYIAKVPALRRERYLEAESAPAPDLIIEVDITSSSLKRFPIYAAFAVPEIWRYDGERVRIYGLLGHEYREQERSPAFPWVGSSNLSHWVNTPAAHEHKLLWIRAIRQWARAAKAPASDSTNS